MKKVAVLALLSSFFARAALSQSTATPSAELSLQAVPGPLSNGIPQRFTFLLKNESNHPIVLPRPILDCGGSYTGEIWLRYHFTPRDPASRGVGFGCAADKYQWPSILDRVKEWKALQAGELLTVEGDAQTLHLQELQAGDYDLWVEYIPPFVPDDDLRTLTRFGYRTALRKLTSEHMHFEKHP